MADGFALEPARRVDRDRLIEFTRSVWPEVSGESIGKRWWLSADELATAAVDPTSGRVAGLCVGMTSQWDIGGRTAQAVSICNWFVSPDYMGRGLGKTLVRSFGRTASHMNAFSISPAAIENFARLGWIGPYKSQLLLLPVPLLRRGFGRRQAGLTAERVQVRAVLDERLAAALEQIDRDRPAGVYRAKRGKAAWQAHLSYAPARRYEFHVIRRDGHPIGYFAIRGTDSEAGRAYRLARLGYVSDLVVNSDDPATLAFVFEAIARAPAARLAGALLLCTTSDALAAGAVAAGWLSGRSPGIGPKLAHKAPLYMKGDGFKDPLPDGLDLHLTFFDSDVDLNI